MLGRPSAGLWQRLLFLVAAITVSLSVLAMHQLAANHAFAAPATSGSHVTHHRFLPVEVQQVALRAQLPTGYHGPSLTLGPDGADLCGADCDADHGVGVLSCLLALTLLMLSWLLAPPRECRQALLVAARRLADVIPANERRVSRSLAELSVCRTCGAVRLPERTR
jgi:hypothetical protein